MDRGSSLTSLDTQDADALDVIRARADQIELLFDGVNVGGEGDDKIPPEQRRRLLSYVAQFGRLTHACYAIGVSRGRINALAKKDPLFAEALDEAMSIFRETLFREGYRRAVNGIVKPVVSAGQVVYIDQVDEHGNVVHEVDQTGQVVTDKYGRPVAKKMILYERLYSDSLLQLYPRAHLPEFRDRQELTHNVQGGVLRVANPSTPEEWDQKLAKLREDQAKMISATPALPKPQQPPGR